jgi:hypothetical protein
MNQDSFKTEFDKLHEMGSSTFVLRGSTIIVEVLPPEEIKTASGIVYASPSDHKKGDSAGAHRIDIGRVLMTGPGYWNEGISDGHIASLGNVPAHYEALEVKPGAIVLLAKYSTDYLSHFPGISRPTGNKLAMIKMDAVLAYYPSQEAYDNAKQVLNK